MVAVVWKPIYDGQTKADHKKHREEPVWATHLVIEKQHKHLAMAALDWLLSHPAFMSVNKLNTILVPQLQQGTGEAEKAILIRAVKCQKYVQDNILMATLEGAINLDMPNSNKASPSTLCHFVMRMK